MAAPLSEFLAVLDETLERYGVPAGERLGGRHRRRWCPHSSDHPATLRAPARTRRDHAAPTAHRGRGRGAHRLPEPGRRHGHRADADDARCCPHHCNDCDRGPLVGTGVVRRRRQRGRTALQRRDRLPARGAVPPRGMAGRRAASAWPTGAVRSVGSRHGHRRGRVRHHPAQRHHHHSGRSGDHRDHLPCACGAGHSPSYPGAAGPPSDDRRRATARTAVLSRAAATEYAGAGDPQRAADDDASDDVRAAAGDGSDTAADATDLTADIS